MKISLQHNMLKAMKRVENPENLKQGWHEKMNQNPKFKKLF